MEVFEWEEREEGTPLLAHMIGTCPPTQLDPSQELPNTSP